MLNDQSLVVKTLAVKIKSTLKSAGKPHGNFPQFKGAFNF